jgi:Uma2 family endonuclease
MAGGSIAHSALCARLASLIDQALPDGPCLVHSSDVKVKITSLRNYFHPDVSVACGEEPGQMLNNPVVVIEVLSPTTEKRDRGSKFQSYKELPSVQEYVVNAVLTTFTWCRDAKPVRIRRLRSDKPLAGCRYAGVFPHQKHSHSLDL